MEIYYEQCVVNNNIDERARRTKTLEIAKYFCVVFAVFIAMSGVIFIIDRSMLFMIAVMIAAAVPFIIIALILHSINKKNNTEYDYVLDDEELKISAVYFRSKRKLLYTVRLRAVESVGVFESDGYKKASTCASKKQLALVNYEDEKSVLYILYNTEKDKRILFIEPDRGFMVALKRALPAFRVFDKSVVELEKYLNDRYIQDASTKASSKPDGGDKPAAEKLSGED